MSFVVEFQVGTKSASFSGVSAWDVEVRLRGAQTIFYLTSNVGEEFWIMLSAGQATQ